jgi:hypothetical protein
MFSHYSVAISLTFLPLRLYLLEKPQDFLILLFFIRKFTLQTEKRVVLRENREQEKPMSEKESGKGVFKAFS